MADQDDDDDEDFANLNNEYVDEMNSGRNNYVLLGKRRRGTCRKIDSCV